MYKKQGKKTVKNGKRERMFSFSIFKNRVYRTQNLAIASINDIENEAIGLTVGVMMNKAFVLDGVAVAGLTNKVEEHTKGATLAGVGNVIKGDAKGITVAGLANLAKNAKGITLSLITNSVFRDIKGIAASMINVSESLKGVTVGLINYVADEAKGLQIGLLNVRANASWYAKIIPGIAIRFSNKKED